MTVGISGVWNPATFGRSRLDERRFAVLIEAPFDMDSSAAGVIGTTIGLDGQDHEVRGLVPSMPVRPITKGQLIELLVFCKGG